MTAYSRPYRARARCVLRLICRQPRRMTYSDARPWLILASYYGQKTRRIVR